MTAGAVERRTAAMSVVAVGFALIVLVFVFGLANPFVVPKEALVAWAAGFALLLVAMDGAIAAEPWPPLWWAAIVAPPLLVTCAAVVNRSDLLASQGAVRWWTYLLFAAAVYLAYPASPSRRLIRLASVLGAVEAAIVIAEVIVGPRVFDVTALPSTKWRAFGTLGNPNWVGALLAATLPLGLAALADAPPGRQRRLEWVIVATTLIGLTLTVSRGAWLAALGGLAVLVALRREAPWRALVPGCSVAVLFAVAIMTVLQGGDPLGNAASVSGRLRMWRITGTMIAAQPLHGWGPGGFAGAYPSFQREWLRDDGVESVTDLTDHPHNEFLQLAAEIGLPAALAVGACAALLIGAAAVGGERRVAAPLFASLTALSIDALGDVPYAQPATAALGCIVLVILLGNAASGPPRERILGAAARGVFAVAAIVAIAQGTRLLLVDRGLTEARRALASGAPARALELADSALRLEPSHGELWTVAALAHRQLGDRAGALDALTRARAVRPDPILWYALADIERERGNREAAIAELRDLSETLPGLLRPRVLLGEAYADAGRVADARSALASVLTLRSKVANPDERRLQARAAEALRALPDHD